MKLALMFAVAFVGNAAAQQISDTFVCGGLTGIALMLVNTAVYSAFSVRA